MAFNNEHGALEIIGDYFDRSNKNHSSLYNTFQYSFSSKELTHTGSFAEVPNSLFDGDKWFEVVNCENAGTLVFSNDRTENRRKSIIQVYIITQNTKWDLVENSNKHLKPFVWTTKRGVLCSNTK